MKMNFITHRLSALKFGTGRSGLSIQTNKGGQQKGNTLALRQRRAALADRLLVMDLEQKLGAVEGRINLPGRGGGAEAAKALVSGLSTVGATVSAEKTAKKIKEEGTVPVKKLELVGAVTRRELGTEKASNDKPVVPAENSNAVSKAEKPAADKGSQEGVVAKPVVPANQSNVASKTEEQAADKGSASGTLEKLEESNTRRRRRAARTEARERMLGGRRKRRSLMASMRRAIRATKRYSR